MTNRTEAARLLNDAKESGITFIDIARHMNVSPARITRWRDGAAPVTDKQLRRLRGIKDKGWSLVKLWSPVHPQVMHMVTLDPNQVISTLMGERRPSRERLFCLRLKNTIKAEVVLVNAARREAVAVKRALDSEERRSKLLPKRGGLSLPRSASTEAAPPPPSPDGAASNPLQNKVS